MKVSFILMTDTRSRANYNLFNCYTHSAGPEKGKKTDDFGRTQAMSLPGRFKLDDSASNELVGVKFYDFFFWQKISKNHRKSQKINEKVTHGDPKVTPKGLPKSNKNRSWGHLGAEDGPQMLQEGFRDPIWTIFLSILDRFLNDFGPNFDRIWIISCELI